MSYGPSPLATPPNSDHSGPVIDGVVGCLDAGINARRATGPVSALARRWANAAEASVGVSTAAIATALDIRRMADSSRWKEKPGVRRVTADRAENRPAGERRQHTQQWGDTSTRPRGSTCATMRALVTVTGAVHTPELDSPVSHA